MTARSLFAAYNVSLAGGRVQAEELAAALQLVAPLQFGEGEVEALYTGLCSSAGAKPRPVDIVQWPPTLHARDPRGQKGAHPSTSPVKTARRSARASHGDAAQRREAEAALLSMRDRLVSNKGLPASEFPGKVGAVPSTMLVLTHR